MGRIVDLNDNSWKSIQYRQEMAEYERYRVAQMEHKDFFHRLVSSTDSFKARLAKEKKPGFNDYPDWIQTYRPGLWCELSFPPKNWKSIKVLAEVAVYEALAPEPIRNHITHKVSFGAWYTPKVKYEVVAPPPSPRSKGSSSFKGVPCLQWLMNTYILSTIEFWSEEGIIPDERYGWTWDMTITPECLGRAYSGPTFWECQHAFFTPLSLVALLAWGGELPVVETVKRDAPWTSYRVEGLPDEIILNDDFVRFVRDMAKKQPLDQAFLSRGMCDTETAGLVKAKLEKLQKPEAPAAVLGVASEPESKTGDGYTDVVYNLTHQMGYKDAEAKAAAKFACEKHPHGTVLEKISTALQSLGE